MCKTKEWPLYYWVLGPKPALRGRLGITRISHLQSFLDDLHNEFPYGRKNLQPFICIMHTALTQVIHLWTHLSRQQFDFTFFALNSLNSIHLGMGGSSPSLLRNSDNTSRSSTVTLGLSGLDNPECKPFNGSQKSMYIFIQSTPLRGSSGCWCTHMNTIPEG